MSLLKQACRERRQVTEYRHLPYLVQRSRALRYDTHVLPPFHIQLTREVRFSVDRDWAGHVEMSLPKTNSWAGWPSAVGIVPYLVLRATLAGQPQQPSGYLCNIKRIDELLRTHAIPHTAEKLRECGWRMPAERLVREIWQKIAPLVDEIHDDQSSTKRKRVVAGTDQNPRASERRRLASDAPNPAPGSLTHGAGLSPSNPEAHSTTLNRLELFCTPYLRYAIRAENPTMVYLTQQFEFSAAHRLHVDALSADENRQLFGKCNNPRGHGHNYFVEVTVAAEPDARTGVVLPLPQFEQLVQEAVIERLDHKHLNDDTPEFRDINPSVENIARVIWQMLTDRVAPAGLHSIRVWETPKTCAEFRG